MKLSRMKLRRIVRETIVEATPKGPGNRPDVNELSKRFADAKRYLEDIAKSWVAMTLNTATSQFKLAKADEYKMEDVIGSLEDAAEQLDNLKTDFS